ncbi:hypothetical protein BGV71_15280 [Burkholderia ubonensis]|nr:hypothetical protein WI76_18125 [Burkholderia ubonensis]KVZ16119.1 hypothetical protein WL13_11000 [Burkholderia ubonensis]KWB34727.1 hypothetical protein WL33_19735 [Burkholderia ubonensis]KWC27644.1 hypothetical protein WL50_04155 [Burkholderia ubonensis]OJA81049.1 hypothetical protein BGV71_15280 [Burkholderia ubonensis]
MARLGVIDPVTANNIELLVARDLAEQFGQNVAVGNILMRYQRRTYLSGVRVEREMHFGKICATRLRLCLQ